MRGHFMSDQRTEMVLGFLLAIVGGLLIWDAFDNRGKKLPWPLSGLLPW